MRTLYRSLVFSIIVPVTVGCGSRSPAPGTPQYAIEGAELTSPAASETESSLPAVGEVVSEPIYTVAEYDVGRDPSQDLADTVRKANSSRKRILLEVGGQWCGWCRLLDEFVHKNETVAAALQQSFFVLKVNYSNENQNKEFLSQYPAIPGYPHIFVLDSDGTFLHSQGTEELEEGRGYNEQAVLAFLEKWKRPASTTPTN